MPAPVTTPAPAMPAPMTAYAPAACNSACTPTCHCGPPGDARSIRATDKWCNIGLGIRTTFNSLQGNEVTDKNYFAIDETRMFFTGKVTNVIGFELNTDISGPAATDSEPKTLTCRTRSTCWTRSSNLSLTITSNIWMGRMLPPSDRSDLLRTCSSSTAGTIPSSRTIRGVFEGRDDGVAYWGQWMGRRGKLKWQFGLYNGQGRFGAGNDWPTGQPGPTAMAIRSCDAGAS